MPAVRITVIDEDGAVGEERIATLPVTFGRDPERVDVAIDDRMVSRTHARLEAEDGAVVVVDLGSGNGTWLEDEQVERRVLRPGDVLTLGSSSVAWSPVTPEPELGTAWCIVVGADGLRALPMTDLHAAWVHAAEQVEALGHTGHRGVVAGVDALLDGPLGELACWTSAACRPEADPGDFAAGVTRLRALPAHQQARAVGPGPDVDAEDRRTLARLASALRQGVAVFAEHGPATPTDGATELLAAIRSVLAVVGEWDQRLVRRALAR